jgi:chaperonin GroES
MNLTKTISSKLKACRKLARDKAAGRSPRSASHLAAALKGRGNWRFGFSSAPSGRADLLHAFRGYRCAQPPANFRQPFRLLPLLRSCKIFPLRVRRELIRNKRKHNQNRTMALNVKPLGDRILVEAVEEKEVKKGGIIIPDTAKEKPMESVVVALGTGKTNDDGKKVPFEVKKGDRILVSKYGGTEIKLDGKEYKILSSDDVLAVIE